MDGAMLTAVGLVCNAISVALFVPGARQVFRHRHDPHALRGVSAAMQVLILANAIGWAVYGIAAGAPWTAVPGLFNGPLALWVL